MMTWRENGESLIDGVRTVIRLALERHAERGELEAHRALIAAQGGIETMIDMWRDYAHEAEAAEAPAPNAETERRG